MSDAEKDHGRLAEGNFQVTMHLSQERTLVVSGYLYADDSPEERNARLDRAQELIDRQFIRCDIQNKRAQRAAARAHIEEFRDTLEKLQARKEGKANGQSRLNSQELQALKQGQDTVSGLLKRVESLDAAILEGERKLGNVA